MIQQAINTPPPETGVFKMSDEQLFQQVKLLLQRNLTPEERKFLALAGATLHQKKIEEPKTLNAKPKVAKIAV